MSSRQGRAAEGRFSHASQPVVPSTLERHCIKTASQATSHDSAIKLIKSSVNFIFPAIKEFRCYTENLPSVS